MKKTAEVEGLAAKLADIERVCCDVIEHWERSLGAVGTAGYTLSGAKELALSILKICEK